MKTLCLVSLAILLISASAATTTVSSTDASWASKPVKILDSTNTTDATSGTGFATVVATTIQFTGSNTSNDTIYAWGAAYTYSSPTYTFTKVIKRTISATTAALAGSETTEPAVQTADVATTVAYTSKIAPVVASGAGYYAFATVSTASSSPVIDTLNVYTFNGAGSGLAASKAVITGATVSSTTPASGTTITYTYSFAVDSLWFENDYFWVLYETITTTATVTTSTSTTYATTGLYLQGVLAKDGTLFGTSAITISSSIGTPTNTGAYVALLMAAGSGNNYTNSSIIQVVWKDGTALKYVTVTKSSSAVGGSATLGTDVTANSFYLAGFIASNYTYGVLVANSTVGTSTTTYGIIAFYNGTTRTTNVGETNLTTTSASTFVGAASFRYTTGFGLVVAIPTSSSAVTYAYQIYSANGTTNGSQTTFASFTNTVNPPDSGFIDYNGAVWYGFVTHDTTAGTPLLGYVGKLNAQANPYTATTTSANVLATFAALLSFVVVSLFMF